MPTNLTDPNLLNIDDLIIYENPKFQTDWWQLVARSKKNPNVGFLGSYCMFHEVIYTIVDLTQVKWKQGIVSIDYDENNFGFIKNINWNGLVPEDF